MRQKESLSIWGDRFDSWNEVPIPIKRIQSILGIEIPIYSGGAIKFVQFDLPFFGTYLGSLVFTTNSMRRARLEFQIRGWVVTVDVPESTDKELPATGIIRRTDYREFQVVDFENFSEYLYWLFSFVRGKRTGLINIIFANSRGEFSSWFDRNLKFSSSEFAFSWLPEECPQALDQIVNSFFELLDDPSWGECLRYLIHWYIEANHSSSGADSSVVMAQITLEILANLSGHDKNRHACDKIEKTLSSIYVPLAIPSSQVALTHLANEQGWKSGPHSITEMRNLLAHGNPEKLRSYISFDRKAVLEAKFLALHYIEYIILNRLGYDGLVLDRTELPTGLGKNRFVPWAQSQNSHY